MVEPPPRQEDSLQDQVVRPTNQRPRPPLVSFRFKGLFVCCSCSIFKAAYPFLSSPIKLKRLTLIKVGISTQRRRRGCRSLRPGKTFFSLGCVSLFLEAMMSRGRKWIGGFGSLNGTLTGVVGIEEFYLDFFSFLRLFSKGNCIK